MKNCSKCIIGAYDASRAPCQNCYDRYAKVEIQKATSEFIRERTKAPKNLAKEDIKEIVDEARPK